jgi:hypothetical protein
MVAQGSARMPREPARSRATIRPAGELEGKVFRGLPDIISLKSRDDEEDERVDLFQIDGVTYSMSVRPRANVSLKYAWIAREKGLEAAYSYALEALLGDDGYQALMNFSGLTQEALNQIVTAASKILAGPAEADERDEEPVTPKASRRRA